MATHLTEEASTLTATTPFIRPADMPTVSFETFTLANGLRVVLSVDRSAPVVATFVHYHVGSKNERDDRTGFAHFFEHLMFEGTKNIPRHEIDKLIQSAGGRLNAFTSFDETAYHLQLPKNELKLALWIEAERMRHAVINEIGVETQRSVVKEERKTRYENEPYGSLMEYLVSTAARGTPYAWPPIGAVQYIDQATIEEFRDFYKQFYVPNNAVLAVVGDLDVAETKELIEYYYGDIPRGADIVRPDFTLPINGGERRVDIAEPNTPLPGVMHIYNAPERGTPDSYALDYLTLILSRGESSRLYSRLVDDRQIALHAHSFSIALESGGFFAMMAMGRTPANTLDELEAEMTAIIEEIRANGVTEREFQKARNQVETEYAGSFTSVMKKAQALATAMTYENDPDFVNAEYEASMSVTQEQIRDVARRYLVTENRSVLLYSVPTPE